eukprot:2789421-Pleurochrysis_carterae.AAC.2
MSETTATLLRQPSCTPRSCESFRDRSHFCLVLSRIREQWAQSFSNKAPCPPPRIPAAPCY